MRISKVYTKTGDRGKTRLAGGQEVWKDALRVEAYGTIDELNSLIGLVRVFYGQSGKRGDVDQEVARALKGVQNKLLDIGGVLATVPGQTFPNMPSVNEIHVKGLEELIDQCQEDLEPLKEFILPGGGSVSGFLHLARTVCRRAERVCVKLSREEPVDPNILKYLNRLSDALFVLARWVAKHHGEQELLWERE